MLSPLLFNIFFAAVLNVVLQRFSEDPAILAELVHLKKLSTSMGPEPAIDYVRRAVWGMLYTDDACIISRSPQVLAKMMDRRSLPSIRVNRVGEEDRDHVYACLHRVHRGRWCESKRPGKSTNGCNPSPT